MLGPNSFTPSLQAPKYQQKNSGPPPPPQPPRTAGLALPPPPPVRAFRPLPQRQGPNPPPSAVVEPKTTNNSSQ